MHGDLPSGIRLTDGIHRKKADFDQGNYANVGHYLNIIDDSYTITGFAVNQKSAYGNTYGQVFSGMEYEGDCFSVDDYCGFFYALLQCSL